MHFARHNYVIRIRLEIDQSLGDNLQNYLNGSKK